MTTQRDSFLAEIKIVRGRLAELLDGMDYCLDWKPDENDWCAREVVYHLVDTPVGGLHMAVQAALKGSTQPIDVRSQATNMTEERQALEIDKIQEDLEAVLAGLEGALDSVSDAELAECTVLLNLISRSETEEWSAQRMLDGLFLKHWREHLDQIAALRDALGLD